MNLPRWTLAVSFFLSLIGAFLSGALLRVHVAGKGAGGFLAVVCGGEGAGCDKVVHSRWAVVPPAKPATGDPSSDAASRRGSLPVAAIGLFYFSILTI